MKQFILIPFFLLLIVFCKAQDFPYGAFYGEEMDMKRYDKDTSAAAVVLKEYGTARVNHEGNRILFEYHVKIKVFDSQRFERADVVIPIQKEDKQRYERVFDIKGVVFYPDDGGFIQKMELNPKSVFTENKNSYWDLVKFALPNVKDGAIVEYRYTLESPFLFNFHPWEFQWEIPKMYSEYEALIPAIYTYNATLIGPYSLTKNESELVKDCFQPGGGYKADCSKMTYGMADIPAFIEEDYMTAPKNFISAIQFELAEVALPNGGTRKITQEWDHVDRELKQHAHFGRELRKGSVLKQPIAEITSEATSELEKAKQVYRLIQKWFSWNHFYGKYSQEGIKKAVDKRSGNVGDINLCLISTLKAVGLDAEPVILSTRENGLINKLYPVLSDFDYVVAKVNIGDDYYLLDGTDPFLPFGLLPLRCINDQGRVMNLDKPSYWIDLKASQKRSNVYNLNLILDEDGKIRGTVQHFSLGYAAYMKRKKIKSFHTIDEYVTDLDERMPTIRIVSSTFQNIDSLDQTLGEQYEIEMDGFNTLETERLYFNPFFMEPIQENPFKLVERSYPVDLGARMDSKVQMTLTFPKGYEVEYYPPSQGLSLPDGGGRFITSTSVADNTLIFSEGLSLNKSIYQPSEYPYLKELFNQIISLEKTDIILIKSL